MAGVLSFMGGYPDPVAAQGELYKHRLVEAFKHIFAVQYDTNLETFLPPLLFFHLYVYIYGSTPDNSFSLSSILVCLLQ